MKSRTMGEYINRGPREQFLEWKELGLRRPHRGPRIAISCFWDPIVIFGWAAWEQRFSS